MKITNDLYTSDFVRAIVFVAMVFLCAWTLKYCSNAIKEERLMQKQKQEHERYLIDSLKAHVLYEDTWGKVLLIENEDL